MIIKTKKYKLENKTFIKLGMLNIVREQWWVGLIYLAINAPVLIFPSWWWFIGATIGLVGYALFWLIQFTGVTQLDQYKTLFEKLSYEIDSRQVLIKLNSKQGMPVNWDMIKKARVEKNAFLLIMSKAQFIYLPYKVFNTDNERKFLESILRRKKLISE